MTDARRLWYWDGAASISQLAVDGTKKPNNCKFTLAVPEITILGVIEIIPCSENDEPKNGRICVDDKYFFAASVSSKKKGKAASSEVQND